MQEVKAEDCMQVHLCQLLYVHQHLLYFSLAVIIPLSVHLTVSGG